MTVLSSLRTFAVMVLALALASCGGGATTTVTTIGNGGSGGSGGTTIPTTASVCEASPAQTQSYHGVAANNKSPLYMDQCLIGDTLWSSNTLYVSLYLCAPGSSTACGWVDHVEVDTGSVGLRLLSSAIPTAVLSAMPTYQVTTSNGTGTVGECFQFVTSYTWGAWRHADVRLGGTPTASAPTAPPVLASGIPIQVLNDPAVPATAMTSPTSSTPNLDICQNAAGSTSRIQKTAGNLGANGILGIGLWKDECQGDCTQVGLPITFVQCFSTGYCSQFTATGTGAANPVAAGGLNGLSITVDPVATLGQNRQVFTDSAGFGNPWVVAGYLGYGVPSPAGSPSSTLAADIFTGRIAAKVTATSSVQFPNAGGGDAAGVFLDSGSTAHFIAMSGTASPGVFTVSQLPLQACPVSSAAAGDGCTLSGQPTSFAISALLAPSGTTSVNAGTNVTGINIVDGVTALSANGPFYDGLVSLNGTAGEFDFGIPVFFGRTLYFGIYDSTVAGTPFYGL